LPEGEEGDRILGCRITSVIAATHPNQPQKKNPVTPHLTIQVEKPRASQSGIRYWGQPHQFDGLVGGGSAIADFDKAIILKPNNPNIFYGNAHCHALKANLENAIANLSRAIALSPDEYREMAKTDSYFDPIRDNEQFQALISQ
jgi:hypothetical protein